MKADRDRLHSLLLLSALSASGEVKAAPEEEITFEFKRLAHDDMYPPLPAAPSKYLPGNPKPWKRSPR